MDQKPNVGGETVKLLEGNIGGNLHEFSLWKKNVYFMPISPLNLETCNFLISQAHNWRGVLPRNELYLKSHPDMI